MQPRHFWKMGKIKELVTNAQGVSREAVVLLPSDRQIRRPLNLLIPLEIEDHQPQDKRNEQRKSSNETQYPQSRRKRSDPSDKLPTEKPTGTDTRKGNYRLRPKKQINYGDLINFPQIIHVSMILSLLTLFLSTTQCADASTSIRKLECISGGVKIASPDRAPYELCAEGYCKIYETPQDEEIVHLPPQIVLHDYKVQWKITSNITVGIIETTCAAASFCGHVKCIFSSATMFNPECCPLEAILATTLFLYLIITSCYVFLFVPVTLGKPIRLFTSFIWRLIRSRFNNVPMNRRHQIKHRQRHTDIAKLLLAVTMTLIIPTEACQQVNLFSHFTTICQNVNGTQICNVKIRMY
ncbi:hypothetical protein KIN20_033073 [Parelaphostrongylus tenuis]|uniref:Phlebovirus glycoprotein G2 fusion domain-containing protein n=1 Tax=Parelaphostrongylus tenuis TaxID=148309 RepID=A0AAD5R7N8_PARTN|nr:hypothetical protein KIN20_033073 [Parelaphostrongylus tenuis]